MLMIRMSLSFLHKGVPARESRTGNRLVSPAAGCKKKKMEASGIGPRNTEISSQERIIVSTGVIWIDTAPKGA